MSDDIRMTSTILLILRVFLEDVEEPRYGIDMMQQTGLPSGTLYQALARMAKAGWLNSAKEDIDPVAAGRPARRYFTLNPAMIGPARIQVGAWHERLRPPTVTGVRRPGFAGAGG
jgi:PadR family transcriptional regulator, regulatory protein PadR